MKKAMFSRCGRQANIVNYVT